MYVLRKELKKMSSEKEIWNFAYGGNMNPGVLYEKRRIQPLESIAAHLRGFRLAFNLRGLPLFEPAFANVVPSAGDCVHGVLHRLTWPQLRRLDRYEGKGWAYRSLTLEVEAYDQRKISARVYSAIFTTRERYPSCRYLNLLREGARHYGLQPEYINMLDNHPCQSFQTTFKIISRRVERFSQIVKGKEFG